MTKDVCGVDDSDDITKHIVRTAGGKCRCGRFTTEPSDPEKVRLGTSFPKAWRTP